MTAGSTKTHGTLSLTRPPRTDTELYQLVTALWGIVIPRGEHCEHHDAPFTAFATAFFAREPQVLIRGSRGLSGKTQLMAALGLTEGVVLGSDVNIVGGSEQQSLNALAHMKKMWNYSGAPTYMIRSNQTQRMVLSNNAQIVPLTASEKSVRGPHPARLCVAEGTLVDTPDGRVEIQHLNLGQIVCVSNDMATSSMGVVTQVLDQGYQDTVTLELSNGAKITCTSDHRAWTNRGWVEAQDLTSEDMLWVRQEDSYLFGGSRGVLARPTRSSNERSPQAGEDRKRRASSDLLENRPDALMGVRLRSLRQESVIHTWDISTTSGNFFADGVLVHNCLDEIDEMDHNILESAKGQPMPQPNWMGVTIPAQTVMASTLQHSDGTMRKEMNRFEEEGLPVFNWCFKCILSAKDGWLDADFVKQKQREVSAERFRIEYLLGEPSIGNRAFDSTAVEKTFAGKATEIKKTRDFEQYLVEEPRLDRDYVISADWAQAIDYTVIGVWDVTYEPIQLVYYVRMHRRPYPEMIGYFNNLQKKYDAQGIHDATGLGRVVADQLDGKVRGFVMAGRPRSDMLTEYVGAVERGKISAPRIDSVYKEHLFCSTEDLYSSGKEFHLPDSVCMAALAWVLVSYKFPLVDPYGLAKSDTNWMSRAVDTNSEHVGKESHWQEGVVHVKDDEKDELLSFT